MMFRNGKVIFIAALMAAAAGCSTVSGWFGGGSSGDAEEAFDTPAQVLATEAEQQYQEGDYEEAAEAFQQLKDRYPYSKFALLADLRVGDAYFKAERYDEAVLAYEDFIRLHPKNEGVPYAMYQTGMVYHAQMLSPDRDPTNAEKAMKAFEKLMRDYPNNEWSIKAMPRFQESAARAAAHDMEVGEFYYSSKKYQAAVWRFNKVLTQYPDVGLYDEAMAAMRKAQAAWDEQKAEEAEELAKATPEERAEMEKKKPLEYQTQPFPDTGNSRGDGY